MFDIGPGELLLIVVVAVLVIGPKDLPLALRTAGRWMGKARKVSAHFRTGLDAMIREAEMEELEKKWKAQNEKIMREHPADAPPEAEPTGAYPGPAPASTPAPTPAPDSAPAQAELLPSSAEARVVEAGSADAYRDMPVPGTDPKPGA